MRLKISLFIFILSVISSSVFSFPLINTGHVKPISAINIDSKDNVLFTGDENGTIKIWDLTTKKLIRNLQVSHLPIKRISVNNVAPTIAVLETDNLTTFRLSAWNWKSGKKLFSHKINELPLFLDYSPKGTFILYGKPDFNSLTFINAKNGFKSYQLVKNTGIISSAYISDSEKTLLLYSPSGSIQYWDLKKGKLKISPIRTKGNLSSIFISTNGKYLTGYYKNTLYLIDLVSGKIRDTKLVDKIISYTQDRTTGDIALVTQDATGKYSIKTLSITYNGYLSNINTLEVDVTPGKFISAFHDDKLYFADLKGSLYKTDTISKETSVFSKNILSNIYDIGLTRNSMLIATEKNLVEIKSSLFKIKDNSSTLPLVSFYQKYLPGPVGIVSGPENNFYIYSKNTTKNGVLKKFSRNGNGEIISSDFTSPILSISYTDNSFLSLESSGRCSVIDPYSGNTTFSYTSYGIQSITRNFSGNIIAGRNQTSLIPSPLLSINSKTEEVVPIRDSNLTTFMVDYDPINRTLYSLGFEKKNGILRTVLKSHRGKSLEITRTLLTYPGEDGGASFVVSKERSQVFTSLGLGGIHLLSWNGFTSLESSGHIPRKLQLEDNILFSINSDLSISLWDISHGSFLMDIYVFNNGGWAAIRKDGKIFSSPSAENFVISGKN